MLDTACSKLLPMRTCSDGIWDPIWLPSDWLLLCWFYMAVQLVTVLYLFWFPIQWNIWYYMCTLTQTIRYFTFISAVGYSPRCMRRGHEEAWWFWYGADHEKGEKLFLGLLSLPRLLPPDAGFNLTLHGHLEFSLHQLCFSEQDSFSRIENTALTGAELFSAKMPWFPAVGCLSWVVCHVGSGV